MEADREEGSVAYSYRDLSEEQSRAAALRRSRTGRADSTAPIAVTSRDGQALGGHSQWGTRTRRERREAPRTLPWGSLQPKPSHRPTEARVRPLAEKVRQIGSKTFYWKKDRWTDSSVTQEEADKATVMTQFSDDYFQLARRKRPRTTST